MADKTVRGRFVWHELITPDTAGAHAFYTKVLGWRTQAWDLNPDYTMFVAPSGPLGGSVGRPSESAARWRPYIGTDHIEGTVDQARSLGARVVTDVTEMPNAGKYAILEDPQGVEFGVYLSPSDPAPEAAPKLGEYSWHELATNDFRAAFDFYSALFGWEAIAGDAGRTRVARVCAGQGCAANHHQGHVHRRHAPARSDGSAGWGFHRTVQRPSRRHVRGPHGCSGHPALRLGDGGSRHGR